MQEITPNVMIKVCDSITSDNIKSKADNNPKIKKLTDKPSLYSVMIKAMKTMASPVSSCNNLMMIKGIPKMITAKMVFL